MRKARVSGIYVVEERRGVFKVGYSAHVDRRLKQLRLESSERTLVFVREMPPERLRYAERLAHSNLRGSHIMGEWFGATLADIIAVIEAADVEAQETMGKPDVLLKRYLQEIRDGA